jgi:hypothetical protein
LDILCPDPVCPCLVLGFTTVGQIEDDVRIAQQFKPLSEDQLAQLRQKVVQVKGAPLEDWKRNTQTSTAGTHRDGDLG